MPKLYEFIRVSDKPSLTTEYIGEVKAQVKHSKEEHKFNLANREQRDVLIDIVKKYGLTKDEFTEKDKDEHFFFYKILNNNLRKNTNLVYYYYNKELEYLDEFNESGDKEFYKTLKNKDGRYYEAEDLSEGGVVDSIILSKERIYLSAISASTLQKQ